MAWGQNGISRESGRLVAVYGKPLTITNDDTGYLHFVLYKNGSPVLIGYGLDGSATVLLERKDLNIRGNVTLKARAYTKSGTEQRLDGELEII